MKRTRFLRAFVVYLLFTVTLGGVCFDYSLDRLIAKDVPWYHDAAVGTIVAPIVIPVALVCYVCETVDVRYPIIQLDQEKL